MISVEKLKNDIKSRTFKEGTFTSINLNGDNILVEMQTGFLKISTFQSNNWTRVNIYEYDYETDTWTEEELYER